MTENEFILADRLAKIQATINQYGMDNFYLSFSGGKDSTVLHYLLDMALPYNNIPRVYANTGIEYKMIYEFVEELAKTDERFVIIKPSVPIKPMLESVGYPFKSKFHSDCVNRFEKHNRKFDENTTSVKHYYLGDSGWHQRTCPAKLKYQFEDEKLPFKISPLCCSELKKKPLHKWQEENAKPYVILGIMASEGGQRESAKCVAFEGKRLKKFQPLVPITKEWEDWFIETYDLKICDIYKPPYNFVRTGCKGCPFALGLQEELDTLQKYFPEERKQCEIIWKPVYEEYRRLRYRLKPLPEYEQLELDLEKGR